MRFAIPLVLVAALVIADQVSKHFVETLLPLRQPVDVLPFLALFRTHNEGVAFSFLSFVDGRILIVLMICIVAFVLFLWWRTPRERVLARFGFAVVTAGALGNLIDRITLGHVVDFILVHFGSWSFAIFNLADAAITLGAIAVIADEVLTWARMPSNSSPDNTKPES